MKKKSILITGLLLLNSIAFSYNSVKLNCSKTYEEVIDSGYVNNSEDMSQFTDHCNHVLGGHRVNPGKCASSQGHVWCVKSKTENSTGFANGDNCSDATKKAKEDCSRVFPEPNCWSVWRADYVVYSSPYCN